MEVQIIPATLEMSADIAKLCASMGYEATSEEVQSRLEKILERDDHHFLVAKVGNSIAGFCHGYIRLLVEVETAVEIGGLAVHEDFQGQGVGKKLVLGIEEWTKSIGLSFVVLASNIKREAAHEFYEHLGYPKVRQQFAFEKHL